MIWNFIKDKLENGQKVVLMVVVECKGSTPGKQGFKMGLSEDGDHIGSVGGGSMEYRLMDKAKLLFREGNRIALIKMVHDGTDKEHGSGMICAGSQEVAMLVLESKDLPIISEIIKIRKGVLTIGPNDLDFNPGIEELQDQKQFFKNESNWGYSELIGVEPEIYIFGGGHVGLALSKLMNDLEFKVTVFDNREKSLKTIKENVFAHDIQIIDYDEADDFVHEGNNIYVAIMTSDHHFDGLILEQMIPKKIKYLGMLGSRHKLKKIIHILKKTGLSDVDFKQLDSPMGLEINSDTPTEIAVSIAANIISVKNQ